MITRKLISRERPRRDGVGMHGSINVHSAHRSCHLHNAVLRARRSRGDCRSSEPEVHRRLHVSSKLAVQKIRRHGRDEGACCRSYISALRKPSMVSQKKDSAAYCKHLGVHGQASALMSNPVCQQPETEGEESTVEGRSY